MSKTFRRGIHPPENKATSARPVEVVMPKEGEELIYPLVQHIGAPCNPIIKAGERVLVGQKIADCDAPVSSPVHASVSGIIKEVRPALTPSGQIVSSIIVVNDAKMEEIPMEGEEIVNYSKEQYLKIIREAGVVGLGGAGFPTHIKLNPPPSKKIEFLIVNASECEPYLTTDHRVLVEEAGKIRRGFSDMLKMFPTAKGIIAIETNKPDAIETMRSVCAGDANIEIVPLKPKYPQGSEKQLIFACTGREVPSGALPADVGCIVDNVDTVIAIDRAVHRGRPLMRKIVTVAGGAAANPGNYKVRLGMTYRSLVESVGGVKSEPAKIISGGPMMGVAMPHLDIPIVKTSSAVLLFTEKEAKTPPEQNCIRCGKCASVCPINLLPFELNRHVLFLEHDLFIKHNGRDCIECGSCSFVCPAKRHLAQTIRAEKRTKR